MNSLPIGYLIFFLGLSTIAPVEIARSSTETVLYSFCTESDCADGASPFGGIINVNGIFYGTTEAGGNGTCFGSGCGTVFQFNMQTNVETVLHSFSGDGAIPAGPLIDVKGTLYGTTIEGGSHNGWCYEAGCGTLFSLNLANNDEALLYDFCNQGDCADGADPGDGVIYAGGLLYGSTSGGGSGCDHHGCGTLFSFDLTDNHESVLHSFICKKKNCSDGSQAGTLIDVGGVLYGTTLYGGTGAYCPNHSAPCGTLFSLDPKMGTKTVLYSFCSQKNCTDGFWPATSMINVKGVLYGETVSGGANERGTVFSFNPATGAETVLYSFCSQNNCADGAGPDGLLEVKGKLYGTTSGGGTGAGNCIFDGGCGTAFVLDPKTSTEKVLYSFCNQNNCADGAVPSLGLIDVKGTFLGTTYAGGTSSTCTAVGGCGTVFSIIP